MVSRLLRFCNKVLPVTINELFNTICDGIFIMATKLLNACCSRNLRKHMDTKYDKFPCGMVKYQYQFLVNIIITTSNNFVSYTIFVLNAVARNMII